MTDGKFRPGPDLDMPPRGYFVVVAPEESGPKVDLVGALRFACHSWRQLLVAAIVGACLGIGASYLIQPVFKAEVLAAPVTQEKSGGALSGLGAQFGGLAQLAGIDIPGAGGSSRAEAFATLASDEFSRDFIQQEQLMPILFARKWDQSTGAWRDPGKAPTLGDGVRSFKKSVRFLSEDRKTNLVTIRFEWTDPLLAAKWANQFVAMANDRLRQKAIRDADRSIEYLNREISNTNVVELRTVLYRLVEAQLSTKTLATVQSEFAFRVIDPAVAPDPGRWIRPRRLLVGSLAAVGSSVLALSILVWRQRRNFLVKSPTSV
jgi:LPS O-antigen subunit length determinant protein (WzzB/FepE family)